jgi:hypothetical protein
MKAFSLLRIVAIACIAIICYGGNSFSWSLAAQTPTAQARVASIPLEIAGDN